MKPEREKEKKKERNPNQEREREREREKEIGIFTLMDFDSGASSFLALLMNKSFKKLEKAKLKAKVSDFAVKKVQKHFFSRMFCQVTHLQDKKRFAGR